MSRKPRSDAKLLNLPEEQQSQLADWMLSGIPYHTVLKMVDKEFEVKTSMGALSSFWEHICSAELIRRRSQAVNLAEEVAIEAELNPGRFDKATIDALQQKAFELAVSPGADPKDVKSLFMLVLKARDQEMDEKQLQFQIDKFQFDAAKAALQHVATLKSIASDKGMNQTEKVDAVRRQLFSVLPEDSK